MTKENIFDTEMNWYEIWMQQNKLFFETADKHLNPLFNNRGIHPNLHAEQINAWLRTLKSQWEMLLQKQEKPLDPTYFETLNQLFHDSSQLLLSEWLKCADANSPINTVQELYTLWMRCCNATYQKALQSKSFQKMYADMMNTTLNTWKEQLS